MNIASRSPMNPMSGSRAVGHTISNGIGNAVRAVEGALNKNPHVASFVSTGVAALGGLAAHKVAGKLPPGLANGVANIGQGIANGLAARMANRFEHQVAPAPASAPVTKATAPDAPAEGRREAPVAAPRRPREPQEAPVAASRLPQEAPVAAPRQAREPQQGTMEVPVTAKLFITATPAA